MANEEVTLRMASMNNHEVALELTKILVDRYGLSGSSVELAAKQLGGIYSGLYQVAKVAYDEDKVKTALSNLEGLAKP